MDEDFKKLHDYISLDKYHEARTFLQSVSGTFEKELSDAVVDTYILNIFDESFGFLSFIQKTVDKRIYRDVIADAITECIEIIYALVKHFPQKIEKYTPQIRNVCLKVILTANSKPKEKRRCLELLQLILAKTDYFPSGEVSKEEFFTKLQRSYESAIGEVLGVTIETLGLLLQRYPCVTQDPHGLYKSILLKLKGNINNKKDSPVAECFSFLSAFLAVYTDVNVADIYECIKKRMSIDNYRKTSLREGLQLLRKHVTLFAQYVHKDAEFWYKTLNEWLELKGENLKTAYFTLDALHECLSKSIAANTPENKVAFMKFWGKITEEVFHINQHGYKLRLAILGFGHFAAAARMFLSKTELNTAFYDFINKIERTYLIDFDGKTDDLDYLPNYIQALSSIVQQLEDVTEYELGILRQTTVLMIKLFPRLSHHHHAMVVHPTIISYNHIRTYRNAMATRYLINTIREGVIYTCSHAVVSTDVEYSQDITTYRNYMPFWLNLIGKRPESYMVLLNTDLETSARIQSKIFDEFMATLFYLTEKLNLSTRTTEDYSKCTDPKLTLQAVRVSDFNIFINAIDLYVDILKNVNKKLFKKWTQRFLNTVMVKSKKHPVVSGFYKLLAVGLKISNDLNYFTEETLLREDIGLCYEAIRNSIDNILIKIKLYKDDLKISCIRVILSAPILIVSNMLSNVAPVMISLFSLGRSNLELTELGMDTLEHWSKHINQNDFEPFLREVLPCLDSHLCSRAISEKFDAKMVKLKRTRQVMTRRKIVAITEGDLFKIQKRILLFMTGLSNDMCRSFVENNDAIGDTMYYSNNFHLKVELAFTNVKVSLYLEKFVPRIIELSLYCSERKLRINSCEVLHAIVLIFLGRTKEMTEAPKKDLHGILRKVVDALLILGNDADLTVQKILRPLMLELMHWYSSKLMKLCSHTAIVVETVLDGVTQTTDSAVRDFSCVCISEFVDWSIKQSSRSGLAKDPINVQIILRKIKFFSSHSDPSKRLAAALIFNNIYTILREEAYLFGAYWIELLHYFVTNLSLIDEYDEYDCLTQVHASLNHLQRGFVEKCHVFNETDKDRRIPPNFGDGLLIDVASWLLKQTGSPNRYCREKCFDLFSKIAPLCERGDLKSFVSYYQSKQGPNWMRELYFRNNTLKMSEISVKTLFKWMSDLLCLLDAHTFFQQHQIVVEKSNLPTLREAITFFYSTIYQNNLHTLSQSNKNFVFNHIDKEHFNTSKAHIVKKYIKLFLIGGDLVEKEHWRMFTRMIFENDSLLLEDIHAQDVNSFLNIIKPELVGELMKAVYEYLTLNPLEDCILTKIVPFRQRQILKGLLILKKSHLSDKISLDMFTAGKFGELLNQMTAPDGVVIDLENTAREYCQLKIDLCLRNGDASILTDCLCKVNRVKVPRQAEQIEFGKFFFDTFKPNIINYVIKNFDVFLERLIAKRNANLMYFIEEMILHFSTNLRSIDQEVCDRIIVQILSHWLVFEEFYRANVDCRIGGLKLLEKVSYLLRENSQISVESIQGPCDWIVDCLNLDQFRLLPHRKFEFLNCCVAALPVFLRHEDEDFTMRIFNRLMDVENNCFANLLPELRETVTTTINKFFQVAILAQSKHLFAFSSRIFILVEPKDLSVDEFYKIFMRNANADLQFQLLRLIYTADYTNHPLELHYKIVREILAYLVRYASYEAFERFYVENIPEILTTIKEKATDDLVCVRKSVGFILIRMLFSRLQIDQTAANVECPVTLSAYSDAQDAKKLIKDVIGITSQLLKEDNDIAEREISRNWYRICKCECYNALISVVCNMHTEPMWYNLLFKRELKGRNMLWRNIVDEGRDYTFQVDFDEIPKKRQNLVAIRSVYREKRKYHSVSQSLRYIESQNILNSSLGEDIVRYDFSRAILRSQGFENNPENGDIHVEMQVEIDADELNSHECMATLCGLFQHMHDEKIYASSNAAVPAFVEGIRKELEDPSTSRNVKLYLVKAIEIKRDIFKPYANFLFGPIMKIMVDGVTGANINYFVADLIVMLVSWAEDTENIETDGSATELACFLIKNVNTDRRDIMKYHIDLIKFFVEQWKTQITVPKDYLLEQLTALSQSKKVLPIIHICSIFLANDLPPWNDVKIFMKKLIEILSAKALDVYRSSAEAIGTALRYVSTHDGGDILKDFSGYLVKCMKKLDENRQLICLQAILKHYPETCDNFFTTLIQRYRKYPSHQKGICLKIFLERIAALHDSLDFPIVNLEDLISDDNDQLKIIGLEIIRKTLPVISFGSKRGAKLIVKEEKFLSLLEKISKFIDSENSVCRSTAYDFFMDVYRDDSLRSREDIWNKCKDALLQGLIDHNPEIEQKLIDFWANILPVNTSEKFVFLLRDMYKAGIENHYLGYYVNFLLNELLLREEYQEAIFAYNLTDCTYAEYLIKDNWRERHSTLAPMFAQSYRSQSADDNWGASTSSYGDELMLRNTADDMEFAPTQGRDVLDAEKWDTIHRAIEVPNEEEDPDEKVFKKPLPPKARKIRFHKDETRSQRRFALRELEQTTKAEKQRKDAIKQRQQEVNIYRSYRKGDFPDITLSISDLMTPLKMLVKHDNRIAKIFYTILFESITEKVKGDNEDFVNRLVEGMNNIFENSLIYDTNLMGALFDVALKQKDIRLSPETIVKVASNSGLLSSGALLLEDYLSNVVENDELDQGPSQKRSRGYTNDTEVKHWVKLADLYKELEEWDLVRAVFMHKLDCNEYVMKAINAESRGAWRDAQSMYDKVIRADSSMELRTFYYESYYKCFAELSDWGNLSKSIKMTIGEEDYWDELWDESFYQQKLLPWFMISELRNALTSEPTRNSFIAQVNEALSNTNKLTYTKQNFSEEVSFLFLLTEKFDKVMYFVLNNVELFLSSWASLSPLLTSLKMKKLLKIQNSLEMYNFVSKFNNFKESNMNSIVNDMCKDWVRVYDENLSSIVSIETRTLYRTYCLSILQSKFDSDEVKKKLDRVKFQLEMNLVKKALDMDNFHVAKKYVERNSVYGDSDSKEGIKYSVAYSRLLHLKATKLTSAENQVAFFVNAWSPLNDCLESQIIQNDINLYLSTNIYAYELVQELRRTLSDNNLTINDSVLEAKIRSIIGTAPPSYTADVVGDFCFKMLRNTLNHVEGKIETKDENNLKAIADAHFKLASSVSLDADRKTELIVHVLKAMFYGSAEARQFFPCLLDMEDLGSTYKDTFLREAEKLPEWMFIQWIPQLLANLDTPNIAVIFPTLERVAEAYPQSTMYAYRLSKQKYDFESKSIKLYGEQAIRRLDELLDDPLVDKFLEALSSVSLWTNVVSYHVKQLIKACDVSGDYFKLKLSELKTLCEEEVKVNSRDRTSLKGQAFKEIVTLIQKSILPLGKDIFNANSMRLKLKRIQNTIAATANEKSRGRSRSGPSANDKVQKLSYYSPWLENFSDNVTNLNLEIPGQYDGNRKPLLQYHVKICGFSSEVSRFTSLRSPLKLTIIGSDAKEYPFLVKFGEDLRQDQRIEQIFGLMNNIFNNDSICREKRLNIRTYQVIPLTGTLGLIECVPNAVTYKDLLMDTVPEYRENHEKIRTEFENAKCSKSSESTIPSFRHAVNRVPLDAFRRAIWKLSIDSESFVALRNKFASSHAVNCIANWILGIGDRNLANSMVHLKNGQTMDIDFGYAFGTGVQILPIAEMVPFRLTPHLVELMRPLKEHGLLEETMIHVLRALRNNSKSLLSTMSVFIKEPSLEWMDFKLRENTPGGYKWCPEKKLDHVRKKLDGASSVEIMVEELQDRSENKAYTDKCIQYVKGIERDNIRTRLSGQLSVEQQVACLIDHATDYALLSRLFVGFEAWV